MKYYLQNILQKGFIRYSTSGYGAFRKRMKWEFVSTIDGTSWCLSTIQNWKVPAWIWFRTQTILLQSAGGVFIRSKWKSVIIKTSFTMAFGLYEYNRIPFEIVKAPATFQGLVEHIFRGALIEHCVCSSSSIILWCEQATIKNNRSTRTHAKEFAREWLEAEPVSHRDHLSGAYSVIRSWWSFHF